MFSYFPWEIANRYLWSRRSEAFITIISIISILGVAIGVMVINVTMSIMSGFEFELREKIVGTDSHIVIRAIGGRIQGWRELEQTITDVEGVSSVEPFSYHQALIRTNRSSSGILVRGIAPASAAAAQLAKYLPGDQQVETLFVNSRLDDSQTQLPSIIVGQELSRQMGIFVGQPVALISPQVGSSPLGLVPRFKRYLVSGFYNSGLIQYESGLAYMSLAEAQKFFQLGDAVSGIDVRVNQIDLAPSISAKIMDKISGFSKGLYAQDWTETNKPLWDALRLEKKVYFIVLLLIIIMASFSIVSTLVLLVMEKRSDIAVLRTLGATSKEVGRIFLVQGATIGFLGTVFGLLGGYIGCVLLRQYGFPLDERVFGIASVPVQILPMNFILSGVASFLICFVATIYPARRASGLDPAHILRYE